MKCMNETCSPLQDIENKKAFRNETERYGK
jgi:hypothetical protein